MKAEYQVSESVRNYKGWPWVNLYIIGKYLMVVPISKRWHRITPIVLAVLFGVTFIGNLRGPGDATDTAVLLFFLLLASVAFSYAYKALRVRRLRLMSVKEISRQPGFVASVDDVKVEGATVHVGAKTLELKEKDAQSLADFLKK